MAPPLLKVRTLLEPLGILLVLAVVGGMLITRFEDRFIYFPAKYPEGIWNPQDYGLAVQDVKFKAADGVALHGWWVAAEKSRGTLLWFHGNAGNLSHRLDNLLRLRPLNLDIFIFDYRGYGKSGGEPTGPGLSLDARAACQWVLNGQGVAPQRLFLFGRSLGGVFAVETALEFQPAGLILESTFTSARDMARRMFPFIPVHRIINTDFDSEEKVRRLAVPKLFLHGTEDEVVPYALGKKLFAAASPPKTFYDIPGAGHNDTYVTGGTGYLQALDRFVTQTLAGSNPTSGKEAAHEL
ncbi:MAG: alpha/beta hydrolase [Nitrospinaceae bacterium]